LLISFFENFHGREHETATIRVLRDVGAHAAGEPIVIAHDHIFLSDCNYVWQTTFDGTF
jgi:hypothetical protein